MYYHERSVNHQLEEELGSSKWLAKNIIKKTLRLKSI